MDYEPGTGSKQLFPKMHLETCGGPLSGVRAMVELQTNHIGKGCDRETYSEKSLQKLCGEREKNEMSGEGEVKSNKIRSLVGIVKLEWCRGAKSSNNNERQEKI